MIIGNITRKYRLSTEIKRVVGITGGRNQKRKGSKTKQINMMVRDFFERDYVSKMTSGQKQTVTFRKMQETKTIALRHNRKSL